ncbi:hypothetical protein ASG49_11060 [Marmoricola sp. Leaf446]|uniref:PH domain-containing protein n=1 Tax=Marmoricola sp. Leaf446 TaxID=1736379 RepID=UPI0006FA3F2E|nr:PH domain-containing protein [Marmoricola sp. Leaf446]KQT91551.1 hypothetical protein ASG49_11060 [Marmoricola sp. Leaf446]
MLGGSALALAIWGAARLSVRGRGGRLRLRRRDGGVEVLGSPWARPQELVGVLVLVVALVGALLALPDAPGADRAALGVAGLAVATALRFFRALWVLRGWRRRTRLVLDPGGLTVAGTDGQGRFAWADLTDVGEDPLELRGYSETAPVPLPAGELLSDPALVARLLRHYLRRPSHRAELGDERVLDRVAGWTGVPTPTRS